MPSAPRIVLATIVAGAVTFGLRALPFLILERLKEARFVRLVAEWMPVGILAILAAATFRSSAVVPGQARAVLVASAVTVVVHVTCGRRNLLSIGAGTLVCVLLLN